MQNRDFVFLSKVCIAKQLFGTSLLKYISILFNKYTLLPNVYTPFKQYTSTNNMYIKTSQLAKGSHSYVLGCIMLFKSTCELLKKICNIKIQKLKYHNKVCLNLHTLLYNI